mmetsp:Transcript_30301/g.55362  ORF Transcript_30301/g.55362 Transcript_30301/m.55362 type:complete len:82 (-) Transcript_30301:1017-1262(-)
MTLYLTRKRTFPSASPSAAAGAAIHDGAHQFDFLPWNAVLSPAVAATMSGRSLLQIINLEPIPEASNYNQQGANRSNTSTD